MKKKSEIELQNLIRDHLVAVWNPSEGASKGTYKVTEENLIDFIKKFL